MSCLRSSLSRYSTLSKPFRAQQNTIRFFILLGVVAMAVLACLAQEQSQGSGQQPAEADATITLPAGTRIPLVLTHPVQSRMLHRGDDIYAQVTAPVTSGNQMVIPPGTFVQGTVERLEVRRGRGELHLQSMAITFPDGYVAPVTGPITLLSDEGYAVKDPGKGRVLSAVALPLAGAGLGAVIGHAAANTTPQTITSSLPPGCVGPPPGCLSSSMTVPRSAGAATVIGAGVGAAAGTVASLVLILSSHHFYLDAGTPVDLVLPQQVLLKQGEVSKAVQQSAERPMAAQVVAPRPVPPPPPDTPANHGTCYTPETPGTPPTVIPGAPGPNGIPGPPTVIPGTPPTPGTPYPCL
jgi:hypothetical protein